MKIYIKNMVCDRCIYVIGNVLDETELQPVSIGLGEVDFGENPPGQERLRAFSEKIEPLGFEIISDKKSRLIEKIKNVVIERVQHQDFDEKIKLSELLSKQLFHDYTYLSNLFSSVEGVTIEQYLIQQKIEKAKELLIYDELSLTEIAWRLGYSSVSHLSNQFRKVTGQTPSKFRSLRDMQQRKPIDKA